MEIFKEAHSCQKEKWLRMSLDKEIAPPEPQSDHVDEEVPLGDIPEEVVCQIGTYDKDHAGGCG